MGANSMTVVRQTPIPRGKMGTERQEKPAVEGQKAPVGTSPFQQLVDVEHIQKLVRSPEQKQINHKVLSSFQAFIQRLEELQQVLDTETRQSELTTEIIREIKTLVAHLSQFFSQAQAATPPTENRALSSLVKNSGQGTQPGLLTQLQQVVGQLKPGIELTEASRLIHELKTVTQSLQENVKHHFKGALTQQLVSQQGSETNSGQRGNFLTLSKESLSGKLEQSITVSGREMQAEKKQTQPMSQAFFQTGHMTDKQQLAWRVSNQVQQQAVYEQVVKRIEHLMAKGDWSQLKNGGHRFTVRLVPESLGMLRVTIVQGENGLMARIVAQTHAAKDVLQAQLGHLKQTLMQNQLNVHRFDVTLAEHETEHYQEHERHQEEGRRSFQERDFEQDESGSEDHPDFETWLKNEVTEHEY